MLKGLVSTCWNMIPRFIVILKKLLTSSSYMNLVCASKCQPLQSITQDWLLGPAPLSFPHAKQA